MVVGRTAIDNFLATPVDDWAWLKQLKYTDAEKLLWDACEIPPNLIFKTKPKINQLVGFYAGMSGRFLYHYAVGTGKTKIVLDLITYYQMLGKLTRALVLVPNVASIGNWMDQIAEHSTLSAVAVYGDDRRAIMRAHPDATIDVINYQGLFTFLSRKARDPRRKRVLEPDLSAIKQFVDEQEYSLVCYDEIHVTRHHRTLTAEICLELSKRIPYRYGLTGTPTGRYPDALWPQSYLIDHGEALGRNITLFRQTFFDMKRTYWGGFDYKLKKSMTDTLKRRLGHSSLVYTLDEITDMPPITYVPVRVDMPDDAKAYYNGEVASMKTSKLGEVATKMQNELHFSKMRQICSSFLYVQGEEAREAITFSEFPKLDYLMDLLESLGPDEPIVIVCEFTQSIEMISDALTKTKIKHAVMHGKTPQAKKIQVVNDFRDGKVNVFVTHTVSGGISLNLQRAHYIFNYELTTSPINREQMLGRCQRMGQKHTVVVYDMVTRDSVEERILAILREGKDVLREFLQGRMYISEI